LKTITVTINIDNVFLSGEDRHMSRRCKTAAFVAVILALGMVFILSSCSPPITTCEASASSEEEPLAGFEQYVQSLYETIELKKRGLDFDLFRYALIGYFNLKRRGALPKDGIISIIDFRKSCTDSRFYVIDLSRQKVLYLTLVAHGRHSGDIYARHFSNTPGSLKSSLGFFVTGDTYDGEYGYSLYLYGMDKGFNDKAKARGIVMHGAPYVTRSFLKAYGKIGRSQGCPALPAGPHINIINTIMGGTCLFQFYDDKMYLQKSVLLDVGEAASEFREEYAPFIQIKLSNR
jgi:L,D-transpeptidase catalytic domain